MRTYPILALYLSATIVQFSRAVRQRLKILALHGKGGSAKTFEKSLQPLLLATEQESEWYFIDAPHAAGNGCQWWNLSPGERSYEANAYNGINESFSLLKKKFVEDGPFDVVMGHSQGAMLASIAVVLSSQQIIELTSPKGVILSGAAWPKPFEANLGEYKSVTQGKIKSLHSWSPVDKINAPTMALRLKEIFGQEAQELEHMGGCLLYTSPSPRD